MRARFQTFPTVDCRHCASAHDAVFLTSYGIDHESYYPAEPPVLAALLLSVSVTVFAAGGGGGPRGSGPNQYSPAAPGTVHMSANTGPAGPLEADTATVAGAGAIQGKTRAQVRAELLHAEEAGLSPIHKNDYPPSAETVAHNRARFQQIEQAWKTDGQITASDH